MGEIWSPLQVLATRCAVAFCQEGHQFCFIFNLQSRPYFGDCIHPLGVNYLGFHTDHQN